MRIRPLVSALALGIGFTAAAPASADLILNFKNVVPNGAASGSFSVFDGARSVSYSVHAGMLEFRQKEVGSSSYLGDLLDSFCIEPKTVLRAGDTLFRSGTLTERFGSSQVSLISRLYDLHYDTVSAVSQGAAAFQLALWEIVSDGHALDLSTGNFKATSSFSGAKAVAANWLTGLSDWYGAEDTGYTSQWYDFTTLTAGNSQDQLAVTRREQQVPEPGVLALLGVGVLGSLVFRRQGTVVK